MRGEQRHPASAGVRPLTGVRVLEAGPWISACYAGKLLADLGADVVRVESPDGDDLARRFGPFPGDTPDRETGAVHLYYNANKRSVTLRWESGTGKRLFRALASWVDVLLDGCDPGYFDGQGLGHAALGQEPPRLVTVSVTSLGSSEPYGAYKGSDLISWHGSGEDYRRDECPGILHVRRLPKELNETSNDHRRHCNARHSAARRHADQPG
ncbi:MAG: hypothetical protein EXR49_07290, partial [Dehalococcoidia bacterium]|nr:hypothetical protein [Dehalococcoidia bacterium]